MSNVFSTTSGKALSAAGSKPSAGPGSETTLRLRAADATRPGGDHDHAGSSRDSHAPQAFPPAGCTLTDARQCIGKLGNSYIRTVLHLLQNPHLRCRQTAAILDVAEMPAHRAIDDAKLLQDRHRRGVRVQRTWLAWLLRHRGIHIVTLCINNVPHDSPRPQFRSSRRPRRAIANWRRWRLRVAVECVATGSPESSAASTQSRRHETQCSTDFVS
jgi:hypothetical protein